MLIRLKESLAAGRWEPFRPPVIGLSSLVEEAAAVVDLYLAEGWEEPTHILRELRDRLESSVLLDKFDYASCRKCLVSLIDKCMKAQKSSPDWKALLSILRAVGARMRPKVVIADALECLQELLQEEPAKYHRLDDVERALGELAEIEVAAGKKMDQ